MTAATDWTSATKSSSTCLTDDPAPAKPMGIGAIFSAGGIKSKKLNCTG